MRGLIYAIGACALYALSSFGCVNDRYAQQREYIHQLETEHAVLNARIDEMNKTSKLLHEQLDFETKIIEELSRLELKKEAAAVIAGGERLQEMIKALEAAAQKSKKPK